MNIDNNCPVCRTPATQGLRLLPCSCNTFYHMDCYNLWTSRNTTCAKCSNVMAPAPNVAPVPVAIPNAAPVPVAIPNTAPFPVVAIPVPNTVPTFPQQPQPVLPQPIFQNSPQYQPQNLQYRGRYPELHVEDALRPAHVDNSNQSQKTELKITPEYLNINCNPHQNFTCLVNLSYENNSTSRYGVDLVCVLDVSGSMSGAKIQHVKDAMEFVLKSLPEIDRLAIVQFNSSASVVSNFKALTADNKTKLFEAVNHLSAGGGTSIFRGMQAASDLINGRQHRNSSVCCLLLTDGQDSDDRDGKIALANAMKASGVSFFSFGFGQDHDAAQLNEITNAAEGSFVYVTDDEVIDAFGGTLGAIIATSLKNIVLEIDAVPNNAVITAVNSGRYTKTVTDRKATVNFVNLFPNETRDVLVTISVPGISEVAMNYPILNISGRYSVQELGNAAVHEFQRVVGTVNRLRIDDPALCKVPQIEVEIQQIRIEVTKTITDAIALADSHQNAAAVAAINELIAKITRSTSYTNFPARVQPFIADLRETLRDVENKQQYHSLGGRAKTYDKVSKSSAQRACFNSSSNQCFSIAQSSYSAMNQSNAVNFKQSKMRSNPPMSHMPQMAPMPPTGPSSAPNPFSFGVASFAPPQPPTAQTNASPNAKQDANKNANKDANAQGKP